MIDTRLHTNPRLPQMGKELLRRLSSKELTMADFEKETAYWMLDTLEDTRWRLSPSKPDEIIQYNERRRIDKSFTLPTSFWQQPHIRAYMATESEIRATNRSNWHWLNEMQRLIPKEDQVNHAKINKIMRGYPSNNY